MELTNFTAISPVDGRYRKQTVPLARYFSEFGLIQYRVLIEVEYFIALAELPLPQMKGKISVADKKDLRDIYLNFSEQDAARIKEIEKTTNHDVKAVEYFLKEQFDKLGLASVSEFVHFGLTSQDINNTAIPLSLLDANVQVMLPELNTLVKKLKALAKEWKNIPMLAKTHGQPASPTKL